MGEEWTTAEAAKACGFSSPQSFRAWASEHKIKAIRREPGAAGQSVYDADAIRAKRAAPRKQGSRTDLKGAS